MGGEIENLKGRGMKKGETRNPNGRPKAPKEYKSFKEFAKALSEDPTFMQRMKADALSKKPSVSSKAREFILHYGIGKPKETVDLRVTNLDALTDEQLAALASGQIPEEL